MEGLLLLLLFPLIWPLVAKRIWPRTISWREMGINIVGVVFLVLLVVQAGRYGKMSDTEIWNGEVVSKSRDWVSCTHSRSCNCKEICPKSGSCYESCDTCYDHPNDWDWNVYTTAGNFEVRRIDRQGRQEPPRWSKVYEGEPVSREHGFVNYVKAAPDSLFNFLLSQEEAKKNLLPGYPSVYDYQYVDRVLEVGLVLPDESRWNRELALVLRRLGPEKEANVVVVITADASQNYANLLERYWLGGKKNDVVVVLGVSEYPKISWAHVMSWTKQELFKVELRDALLSIGDISDSSPIVKTIEKHVSEKFVRRQMSDFEYLKDEIEPPLWVIILSVILAIGGSVGLSFVFQRTQI